VLSLAAKFKPQHHQAGIMLGPVFLLVFACFSAFGLHLLASATQEVARGATNAGFYAVARKAAPRSVRACGVFVIHFHDGAGE
jgi:hypothetical protein